jgi:hypothetical protein
MSAAVPRDPAQSLHSAHRVLTRTAWLLSGPPEPQQPGQGQHSAPYQKLAAEGHGRDLIRGTNQERMGLQA